MSLISRFFGVKVDMNPRDTLTVTAEPEENLVSFVVNDDEYNWEMKTPDFGAFVQEMLEIAKQMDIDLMADSL